MQRMLVSFDTDRIKGYVFGTDKLKEIRGASSLLDSLNRKAMREAAKGIQFELIYANGGSGLFLVDANQEQAEQFAQRVQQAYADKGASITYVIQELPEDAPVDKEALMKHPLSTTLDRLRYRMRLHKDCAPELITLPSHPFMRPCDSCGINYAEEPVRENGVITGYCCTSCRAKQSEDDRVKSNIRSTTQQHKKGVSKPEEEIMKEELWNRIIYRLIKDGYVIPQGAALERPHDFNVFRQFSKSKEYIGLIYADANNMGAKVEAKKTLRDLQIFATEVDSAIHYAMSAAIIEHLPVVEPGNQPLFPFDILLLGGDDIVMVTDAAKAMDVALTIANKFRDFTNEQHSLSVGVVLTPVNYPFALLQDLAEETLKAAKKASAEARANKTDDDTHISFLVIAGSSVHSYKKTINLLEKGTEQNQQHEKEFHATLRPYTPTTLKKLLDAIDQAHRSGMNRSKLHQMRAAILKMNVTTSVSESVAVLRNWQAAQRASVVNSLYEIGMSASTHQAHQNPIIDFPRVTFPWFRDDNPEKHEEEIYRTSILDFIELYDFVHREGRHDNNAN